MRIFRAFWFRLRSNFQPATMRAEFDEELNFHIDRETQENIKRGMNANDARRSALAQFGGVERFKEGLRDEHSVRWLDDLSADARHGLRLLRKNQLFSATVIGTLALGIGATSTIFAVVNGVLLRPLPFPSPDRIASISEATTRGDGGRIGQHAYAVWNTSARSFSAMALYSPTSATLTGVGEPIDVEGAQTTASFFSVLSTRVAFGRTFSPAENNPGSPRVIVLSHVMWQTTFGGDSAILNRTITLNGNPVTVIGVMPAGFAMPATARYWVALRIPDVPEAEFMFDVIARLRTGVTRESAERELSALAVRVDSLRPAGNRGAQPVVMSLHDRLFGSVEKPLTILLCAVVVLLLIACANVANLTLARSAARQREFAVRLALGAGRWRLIRQLLVESSLLAGIGGVLGILIPVAFVGLFVKLSPKSVAGVSDIAVDASVVLFTVVTTLIVAFLFGLVPALTGSRSGGTSALAAGSSRSGNARAHRALRSALVVFEVSAALTLLTGAALLTKSFAKATAVNPGFAPQNVYSAYVQLPNKRYAEAENARAFFDQLLMKVSALPGVDAVSASRGAPLNGYSFSNELGRTPNDPVKRTIAFAEVDGGYGKTVGLQLISGRYINETDVWGAPPVVMITKSAAQHFFPGVDAVGRTMPRASSFVEKDQSPPIVVGVVEDVAQRSLDVAPLPQVFLAGSQRKYWPQVLIVRSSVSESVLRASIKRMIADIDPLQPLTKFSSLQSEVAQSIAPRRFNSLLVNAFAGLALLLAVLGLYGLMANAVSARTRELGIRMALGAQSSNVLKLVMQQGAWLVVAGITVGALLSLTMSRALSSLLYEVPAQDPVIFVGAALSLAAVALLACYIPARRATRVNPITALREE